MFIKKEIENLVIDSLKKSKIKISEKIEIQHPDILKYGDYTCNVALFLTKTIKENPFEIAKKICYFIDIKKNNNIERIEIASSGYINFFLSKYFFKNYLKKNYNNKLKIETENIFNIKKTKSILLEHSSPNLFKPLHVGHLVNNSIGESLGRIIKYFGYNLEQISFPSDVSLGIAKTIWDIKNKEINLENLNLQDIASSYVSGTEKYQENQKIKKEIDEINSEIYFYLENKEKFKKTKNIEIYQKGSNLSLEHFKKITLKLGSNFSDIIFESEAEKVGKEIIQKNIGEVFEKSEGAIIFKGSKYGLFDNVFINSKGFGTYLAKDIGLLKIKKAKEFEKSLVITDKEQEQHFQLIKKSSSLISELKDVSKKSEYLQHGRLNFAGDIKISSRFGNVPFITDIIEKVQAKILEKMEDRNFSSEEKHQISEKIAIASLKYSILKVTFGKNIIFDFEKSLNFTGNSAIFLLYTFVRAKSISERKKEINNVVDLSENMENTSDLEKTLYKFNEEVEKSFEDYSPHHLANYLYDLAKKFNSFYEKTIIFDKKNPNSYYNFILCDVFRKTMRTGLDLLGIKIVDKM